MLRFIRNAVAKISIMIIIMKKTITTLVLMFLVAVAAVAETQYSQDLYERTVMGDREAMYQLSRFYMGGNGVTADYERSDYWLERAAKEGQPDAKKVIDMMGGKTALSSSKRAQLAAEEKRERERLLAKGGGNNGGGGTTPGTGNQTFTIGNVSFTMVYVEGGTFTMGATSEQGSNTYSDEKPAHSVTLSSYYIGQTEVTQELWEAVMGSNPSKFKGAKRPVEQVSWDDCQEFIRKLNAKTGKNFRLPTEAEWEYAARGGSRSQHYKYSGGNTIGDVAWYAVNYSDKVSGSTHSVATKRANELGIYDMSGNVWEWCSDWYGDYSTSQTNPQGPASGSYRVYRGGSWFYGARLCRVSLRDCWSPGIRDFTHGLRLAL